MKSGLLFMRIKQILRQNRGFLTFIVLLVLFRGAIADWNVVPTGSMKPTIVEGDYIFVNKLAYDVNVPFTTLHLMELGNPKRGDIVIIESEKAGKRLVKRVVAVPGDVVALNENVLTINSELAHYQQLKSMNKPDVKLKPNTLTFKESIAGYSHLINLMPNRRSPLQNFGPVVVPEGQYLMMGDNRDNSADSRVFGFVPRTEITGKANRVLFSLDYDHNYMPRDNRILTPLL